MLIPRYLILLPAAPLSPPAASPFPWSATLAVRGGHEARLHVLSEASFTELTRTHPGIAIALLNKPEPRALRAAAPRHPDDLPAIEL